MKLIKSTNPGDGYSLVGEVPATTKPEIDILVAKSRAAIPVWRDTPLRERKNYVSKLITSFEQNSHNIIDLEVKEIGKTFRGASLKFETNIKYLYWLMENIDEALKPKVTYQAGDKVDRIFYEPYGQITAIAPWNYPFQMFIWSVVPSLLMGNTVVFKHSEECIVLAKLLDDLVKEVGFPTGVFGQVFGDGNEGRYLVNQGADLFWFTGSTKAGQDVYRIAGEKFVTCIMELGGSNPGILFEDSEVDRFLDKIYYKRFSDNCGQTCDAIKRLLVHESIYEEVIDKLKTLFKSKKFGINTESDTDIGPLASNKQLVLLEQQVADAISKGARVVLGGRRAPELDGAYYEPTILADIKPSMRVWNEEVFGPSLSIIPFSTEAQAVEIANSTDYGLGAVVFTQDKEKALRVSRKLKVGSVEINDGAHWKLCNPFGGVKKSGKGRGHGILGLRCLSQRKLICS